MKQPWNWPALIVLAVVAALGAIGVLAILYEIKPQSHDIVLTIVSGFIGALTMKAADSAIRAVGSAVQAPPASPAPQPAAPVEAAPAPSGALTGA